MELDARTDFFSCGLVLYEMAAKARQAYQDFFAPWKNADPDITILQQAKAEYAKLEKILWGRPPKSMAVQAKQITVLGRVQGVGFRYFVQNIGNRLGLAGKVRNCPDRTVEIIVQGELELLEEFIKEVAKGPPLARVDRLEIKEVAPGKRFGAFQIDGW